MVKLIISFCVAFEKVHDVAFLTDCMEDIVKGMDLSVFISNNSPNIFQHLIQVAKVLLQALNILSIIVNADVEETESKTLEISYLKTETLISI